MLTLKLNKMGKVDLSWIGGAAGGLLGSIGSAISSSKMIKAQKQENALNRQFNADEAQKSRDFELDMFNRTNSYNTPKNVVNRLVDAGLNPALAFGGFQNADFGGNSAAAFSNGGVGSPLPDFTGLSSAGQSYLNARLIESQANKNDAEAANLNKQTSWIDKAEQAGIDLKNSQISLNSKQEQQLDVLMDNIDASTKEINNRVPLLGQQLALLKKDNFYYDLKATASIGKDVATIQDLFADAHLKDIDAFKVAFLLGAERNLLVARTNEANSQASLNAQYEKESQSREKLNNQLRDESSSRTDLNNFQNLLNEQKLRDYGLSHLSKQQVESIQQTIDTMKSQMYSNYGHLVIDGINAYSNFIGAYSRLVEAALPW